MSEKISLQKTVSRVKRQDALIRLLRLGAE
jgi:hypothetical protein